MFVVKLVIIVYLSLLPIAAWTYREQLSRWLLIAYACPVLICCLFLTSVWSFLLGLFLACGVRVVGGRMLFGKNHLSHFLVHFLISLILVLGLFLVQQ